MDERTTAGCVSRETSTSLASLSVKGTRHSGVAHPTFASCEESLPRVNWVLSGIRNLSEVLLLGGLGYALFHVKHCWWLVTQPLRSHANSIPGLAVLRAASMWRFEELDVYPDVVRIWGGFLSEPMQSPSQRAHRWRRSQTVVSRETCRYSWRLGCALGEGQVLMAYAFPSSPTPLTSKPLPLQVTGSSLRPMFHVKQEAWARRTQRHGSLVEVKAGCAE